MHNQENQISTLISQIARNTPIEFLFICKEKEACMCYLKVVTGFYQTGISQHWIGLQKICMVSISQSKQFIFYYPAKLERFGFLKNIAQFTGDGLKVLRSLNGKTNLAGLTHKVTPK